MHKLFKASSCKWAVVLTLCCLYMSSGFGEALSGSPTASGKVLPSLFIVGDSTANIHEGTGATESRRVGWGTPFASYFDASKIRIVNAASAGRSSRTFIDEGKWNSVLQQLKPGDYVLIQFGHNDPGPVAEAKRRGSLPGIGEQTQSVTDANGRQELVHTFGWYLRKYIADTRAKGATPIVLSVTPRDIWTDGKVERGLGQYREWAAEVAQQEGADYVDVTGIVAREYERLGEARVRTFFPLDHTHTDAEGAQLNAACVVAGLKALPDSPFTSYFSPKGDAVISAAEATMQLPKNVSLPTLWIIGDSTVRNGQGDGANGQWGWGDEIAPYFDPSRINVVNRALGGRSSRTYYRFDWPTVRSRIKRGDFVIMQFGHNDSGPLDDRARARGTLPGNGEETKAIYNPITRRQETVHTYGWYLRQMIAQTQQKDATAIVCSLIPRKIWNGGKIVRAPYVEWAKQAAHQEHAPFIDLNRLIADRYEKLGPAAVDGFFADAHTHTTLAGAKINAEYVIEGLNGLKHHPLLPYMSSRGKAARKPASGGE